MNKRFESIETSFLKFYFYKFFNHLTYFLYPIKLFIKYKKFNLNNVSSVCILNQWGLGDSVQCAFIVNALLKYFPNLKISVIGNSLYKPLFLKKNIKYFSYLPPWVNKKNKYNFYGLKNYFYKSIKLRRMNFDLIISNRFDVRDIFQILFFNPKSAFLYKNSGFGFLFPNGFSKSYGDYIKNSKFDETLFFLNKLLCKNLTINNLIINNNNRTRNNINYNYAVIHAGASDKERFLCLSCNKNFLIKCLKGYYVYIIDDKSQCSNDLLELFSNASIKHELWRGDIENLRDLIKDCDLFVGTDSGPLNIALSLSRVCIGFYISQGKKVRWFTNRFNKKSFATFMHHSSCIKHDRTFPNSIINQNERLSFIKNSITNVNR